MAKRQQAEDMSRLLPEDVLADALSRAAPRDLAVARCVCRAWRALIDGRRMLSLDFLPRSLAGLFIDYSGMPYSEFYARPSVDIAGYHLPRSNVLDHCNGLVLVLDGVLNPATGGWTPFPEPPPLRLPGVVWPPFNQNMYLAFDPTVSSHYEVFLIPNVPPWLGRRIHGDLLPVEEYTRSSEWPPSPWKLKVFSSRDGRWDERCFVRENEAAGTAADMTKDLTFTVHRNAICWRGALYVHYQLNFLMRISLSDDKYRVIEPPIDLNMSRHMIRRLDKSEKGVYFALLGIEDPHLRVWILDESSLQTQWILKHDSVRGLAVPCLNLNQQVYGPWILQSDYWDDQGNIEEAHEIEWNSDDDNGENILQADEDRTGKCPIEILAFHPFQEIVFLHTTRGRVCRGLAYHLNSFKLEDLGNMRPKDYGAFGYVRRAVPYTPCLMGEFSEKLEFSDDES